MARLPFAFAFALLLAVAATGTQAALDTQPLGQPASPLAGSPLAASADAVFAISATRRQIVTRSIDTAESWRVFDIEGGDFSHLAGIAIAGRTLYFTDSAEESIYRADIDTRELTPLISDGPIGDPGSIAVAGDVFVIDDDDGRLYRIMGQVASEVALAPERLNTPASMAAVGNDLFIASRDGILELKGIGRSTSERDLRQSNAITTSKTRRAKELLFSVQKRDFPEITKPSRIAVWSGIVYVVDDALQAVFAFGREDQRPVKLSRQSAEGCAGGRAPNGDCETWASSRLSLAVNESRLLLLADDSLSVTPRPVPVEVVLPRSSRSEAMTDVYAYLSSRGLLSTRLVQLDKNVELTLKQNGVLLGAYPETFTPLLCKLNPSLCSANGQIRILQPRQQIVVPDLRFESFVDAVEVTIDGTETLEQIARRQVRSAEFDNWVTEAQLTELNTPLPKGASISALPPGTYVSPIEYIRYVIPAHTADAKAGGSLKRLESKYAGLYIQSLEERLARAAQTHSAQDDFVPLTTRFKTMLATINYDKPGVETNVAKVGVAENYIDQDHPDFQNAWVPAGLSAVPAGVQSDTGQSYKIRSSPEASDHGTMVAALIAARTSQFGYGGLAPSALLLPVRSADPAIEEDVRQAFLRNTRIFNISAHYGIAVTPAALQRAVDKYRKALFVVAAGNDATTNAGEICAGVSVYPACWHDRKNVIVVTATTLEGQTLLPGTMQGGGANWSARAVHLAAPGDGYYASGSGRSYAPARGTSFAAPLVTATAALLYARNVTDPWVIKQRLIATADPMPGYFDKVFAGMLNVRLALADTGYGVLVRQTRDINGAILAESRERVTVDSGQIVVTPRSGSNKTIPALALRRVHRNGSGYRIVYVEDDELKIIDGASFPSSGASQFQATTAEGLTRTFDFTLYVDYIAAAASLES